MTALLDGLSVLKDNWWLALGILSLILLGQFLIYSVMKLIFGHSLTAEEYYSLGAAGWILPISLISLLSYMLRTIQLPQFSTLIIIVTLMILAVILFFRIKKQTTQTSRGTFLVLLLLFWISIPLRLAFVSKAIFPLYFDSATHYTIIKNLMGNMEPSNTTASFQWLGTDYYHVGFHFLAAFLS